MNRVERRMKDGGSIAVTGEGIEDGDVLIAELLIELAQERKTVSLAVTEEVMDEIIVRARARGFDPVSGEWRH